MKRIEESVTPPVQLDYDQEQEIGFGVFLRRLFKEWRIILKWCGYAALIGLVIAFSLHKKYTSFSEMAPETVSMSNSGGSLSSLAGLAGISLGSLNNQEALFPDVYPDIVSSIPFVVDLFSTPLEFERKGKKYAMSYYEYNLDFVKPTWMETVVRSPVLAIAGIKGLFQKKVESEDIVPVDPSRLTYEQAEVVGMIRKDIVLSIDKKNSMVILTVQAEDPEVAGIVAQKVISNLQTYIANYRTKKARLDLEYYEQLYEEAKRNYYTAQQRYADHMDRNQGIIMQRAKAEQDRLQNEMSLAYQLYNSCAQQVQAAKAKVQQDTPVFTIIQPPQVPLRGKPSRPTVLFAFILVGALLSCVWILWGRNAIASLRKEDEEKEPAADAAPKKEDAQA